MDQSVPVYECNRSPIVHCLYNELSYCKPSLVYQLLYTRSDFWRLDDDKNEHNFIYILSINYIVEISVVPNKAN